MSEDCRYSAGFARQVGKHSTRNILKFHIFFSSFRSCIILHQIYTEAGIRWRLWWYIHTWRLSCPTYGYTWTCVKEALKCMVSHTVDQGDAAKLFLLGVHCFSCSWVILFSEGGVTYNLSSVSVCYFVIVQPNLRFLALGGWYLTLHEPRSITEAG